MSTMTRFSILALTLAFPLIACAQAEPLVEQYLETGKLAEGEAAVVEHLRTNAQDDQARFGLGTLQVIRAVEHLMQNLYAAGLRSLLGESLPFARLPVRENPNPKPFTYEAAGAMIKQWSDDLTKARQTLAEIKSTDVKLPIKFGLIRLDFNGDGKADDDEALWKIYEATTGGTIGEDEAKQFIITFDAGDVQWLRGYCHMLLAFSDMVMAYDEKELFDSTAQLFFKNVQTPYPFLQKGKRVFDFGGDLDIADAVAFIHLIRCPVAHPERMKSALDHLQAVLQCSRDSWKLIQGETDNDHEWLPNAKQESVISGAMVTEEMISNWMKFLDQAQSLLDGKTLLPFWRGNDRRGVNLRRVFTEPRPLDLVLWVQGTAAAPYLEDGPITDEKIWSEIWQAFGRESFFGFAVWFN